MSRLSHATVESERAPTPAEGALSEGALGLPATRLSDLSAPALMEWAAQRFGEGLMMSTSFGIQSAVTLHLATRVRPDMPVVWIDTGYLPDETYQYAETLARRLDLNLRVYRADLTPGAMETRFGRLWETGLVEDLELYDWVRKVEPMRRAMEELRPTAWVSGLRADQTDFRKSLGRVTHDGARYRVLPILRFTSRDVYRYMTDNDLPQHPLWEQGYTTVGDWHSSRAVSANDSTDRATRFGGLKQECGIHLPGAA
ncbi:MAG: phosphoadenylyl-sulfate reductase [Planctomycetota bacterium]